MDQDLLIRFRSGDAAARTALRNQLRAVCARVLGAPQWGFSAERRRALEVAAANEALESDATDPVGFALSAMRTAARAGLEALRQSDPLVGAHPDSDILVGVAMETASRAQKMRLDKHLEDCKQCRLHFETVKHALKTAASAQKAAAPQAAPVAATEAPEPRLRPPAERSKPERPKKKPARDKPKRRARPPKKDQAPFPLWQSLLVVALVGGGIWWSGRLSDEEKVWQAAALLPDEAPPSVRAELYEGNVADAIEDIGRGRCRGASTQLNLAWESDPEDLWLRYFEGLAKVCERDPSAIVALQDVNDQMHWDELPWGFAWWYAQALILDQQYDEALVELDQLASSEHARAADAQALADRVRAR